MGLASSSSNSSNGCCVSSGVSSVFASSNSGDSSSANTPSSTTSAVHTRNSAGTGKVGFCAYASRRAAPPTANAAGVNGSCAASGEATTARRKASCAPSG